MSSFPSISRTSGYKLMHVAAPIFLLTIPFLFASFLGGNIVPFRRWVQQLYASQTEEIKKTGPIARLVRGEHLKKFETRGFACDIAEHSVVCVTNNSVTIDTRMKNITVQIIQTFHQDEITNVWPYARQEDPNLYQYISSVKIFNGNYTTSPPVCQYNHQVPAVIFSSGLSTGNTFHEFNDIIIPLFITISHFRSRVFIILEDYNPTFLSKFNKIVSRLSDFQVMDPNTNRSVHCFPGSIVGLKYHDNMAINSSEIPLGNSMPNFRQFLRETFALKFSHISELKSPPKLMLISRETSRKFLNEDDIIRMIKQTGFELVIARAQELSNLSRVSDMVNSCSVLVGTHGAGITNELFLPDGAVMVQVEPLGLEWASTTYFGNPTSGMNLHYLRYKIMPEESSLVEIYGRNHSVINDPASVFAKGYQAAREVYVDQQDVRLDIGRFRETIAVAFQLVTNSSSPGLRKICMDSC